MGNFLSDGILSDDDEEINVNQSSPFYESGSIFPKDCGRSSLVNWRWGGASKGFLWSNKGQKITGGRTALQGQFPWMVTTIEMDTV